MKVIIYLTNSNMYYVIVSQETCEQHKVFKRNKRTPDGRVVLTLHDLSLTRFSYGSVEIVNSDDLKAIMSAKESQSTNNNEVKGNG